MRAFVQRLGSALVAPRWLAVKLLDQKPGRGSSDVMLLLFAHVVLSEFPRLLRAVVAGSKLGWDVGASQALQALQPAIPVVIAMLALGMVASVAVGRARSDYGADLGAYAAVPYVVLRIAESLVWPLLESEPRLRTRLLTAIPAIVWGLTLLVVWIRLLRRGVVTPAPAPPPASAPDAPSRAGPTGVVLLVLLIAAAVHPLRFSASHWRELTRVTIEKDGPAPTWTLPSLEGDPVALTAERGRVVVLVFWATWCGVCKTELPILERLYGKLDRERVRLYTISTDGSDAEARALVAASRQKMALTMPTLLDDGRVASLYNVTSIPQIVVISPDGRVKKTMLGITTAATVEQAIDAARQ